MAPEVYKELLNSVLIFGLNPLICRIHCSIHGALLRIFLPLATGKTVCQPFRLRIFGAVA